MKRFFYLTFLLSLFTVLPGRLLAQSLPPMQPEQDACNALQLCGGTFSTPFSYTGYGQIQEQTFLDACYYEGNSVWFKLVVTTPGTIVFTMTPVIPTNDYDFAVYNITNSSCSTLSAANRIRCSGADINSTPNGITGLNTTSTVTVTGPGPGVQYLQQITAAAGDVYLLMIDNFETVNVAGFSLDFTGSTATFFDNTTPGITSHDVSCNFSSEITLNLSEPVQCSSISANGSDFTVGGGSGTIASAVGVQCTGPSGYTTKIKLTFANPLTAGAYTINAANGTDNNTVLDLCGNPMAIPTSHPFVVAPYTSPTFTIDTPACTGAKLHFDRKIKCSTVAVNGSDFTVTGPSAVTVTAATAVGCDALGTSDTVEIKFASSIRVPGTYTITPIVGTDNNSVTDTCLLAASTAATFVVSDRGLVSIVATPDVLCEPGYVSLVATPEFQLPPPIGVCGPHVGPLPNTSPVNVTVGNGTAGTTTWTPFYGFYCDARQQILYRVADLAAAGLNKGTITQLTFNITSKASSAPYNNFTIKMGCTNVTSMPSNNYVPGISTIVYGPVSYSTVAGNNVFNLTTPFDWDSTSNLIVELCFDNTNYTSSDNIQYTTVSGYTPVYHLYYDNPPTGQGCAMIPGTYAFGGNTFNRPNIRFQQRPRPDATFAQNISPGAFVGDTTAFNTIAYVPKTTTYQIEIKDSMGCFRRATDEVIVSVRNPSILSRDTNLCIGDQITLNAGPSTTYQWFPADGLSCTTCASPVASPLVSTRYYVALFDQYGCSDTLSVFLRVDPLPVVNASPEDTLVIFDTPVQLIATSPGGRYYLWDPVTNVSNPASPNPIVNPRETTRYTVTVIDTNQCRSTDSVLIRIRYDVPVFVPDAFTPNGDGVNDIFRVSLLKIQRVQEFRIMNRWGQEVFTTTDGTKGWDGTFKGEPQAGGVYNYLIRVAYPDGKSEFKSGTVTLIR